MKIAMTLSLDLFLKSMIGDGAARTALVPAEMRSARRGFSMRSASESFRSAAMRSPYCRELRRVSSKRAWSALVKNDKLEDGAHVLGGVTVRLTEADHRYARIQHFRAVGDR